MFNSTTWFLRFNLANFVSKAINFYSFNLLRYKMHTGMIELPFTSTVIRLSTIHSNQCAAIFACFLYKRSSIYKVPHLLDIIIVSLPAYFKQLPSMSLFQRPFSSPFTTIFLISLLLLVCHLSFYPHFPSPLSSPPPPP